MICDPGIRPGPFLRRGKSRWRCAAERRNFVPNYPHNFPAANKWYRGAFDSVYFAFHPFVSIPGLDVRKYFLTDDVPEVMSLEQKNAIAKERMKFFAEQLDGAEFKAMEKRSGKPVRWETVRDACGLGSYADLCRAEQGRISAVRGPWRNESFEEAEWQYCLAKNIFPPHEDTIPVISEQSIANLLRKLNCSNAILSDEFGTYQCGFRIENLLDPDTTWSRGLVNFSLVKVYAPDHSVLIVVGFDTTITKICGNRSALVEAGIEEDFEGFWCGEDTDDLWWITEEERRELDRWLAMKKLKEK